MDKLKVLLKTCNSDQPSHAALASLQHEYQLLSQLNISGVIHAHDLIKIDNQFILVLEDIDGMSLRNYLNLQPISLEKFFKIALELIEITSLLHARHIIHKNLNPDTILINPVSLAVKLADFSIASELAQEAQPSMHLDRIEGLPAYISPELTGRMNRAIDYRTDFYSLGMIFYEMLTGTLPFHPTSMRESIQDHLEKQPELITTISADRPQQVAAIIAKLLAKMPEDRYLSAAGLKGDIIQCQIEWQHKNQIQPFALGQHDIYDYLTLSPKLYGRETQIQRLLDTFEQVSAGDTQLLLVSGYSGVGKTSLVKELYAPITQKGGYFIKGKCDQLQRTIPYSAIIEAFRELVCRLLAEPSTNLKPLRNAWQAALGNNGKVIIDVIPEIAFIIGPQPALVEMPPAEAQNRFMITLQNFIRAIAQPEHPLVLFLDDLQWIDLASLQLVNSLLSDYELRHCLIIGAYRDNEVTSDHPLAIALNNFNAIGVPIKRISLTSLSQIDIENFLADSFNCEIEQVQELALLLIEKTLGNPFFINQFLKLLYQKKLLTFYYDKREWQWDVSNSELNVITENIISLLTFRINQLPEKTQSLLKLASCIGHIFDLKALATIDEQPISETMQTLSDAISLNLVVPLDGGYKAAALVNTSVLLDNYNPILRYQFIHDNVQQAAYTLIENDVRQQVHLRIARMLLKHKLLQENDDNIFDIVNHYIQSLAIITDETEKKRVAQYCLWAGKKSKASSAYQAAKSYLQAAANLVEPITAPDHSDLTFSIHKELAICEYLTGAFEKAEADFNVLINSTEILTDKLECYKLYCEMLATLNRHEDAIALGITALKLMGITLPAKPNTFHIMMAIMKIKLQLRGRRVQSIELFPVKNTEHRAIIDLISQMFNSAFIINQNLFTLLTCTNVYLSFRYGYANSTGFACVVYAFVVMHALNRYNEGIDFVEFYNRLSQIHLTPSFYGKNNFVLGSFIYPYQYPIATALETVTKAYQYSYESGDLAYSNYCNILVIITTQMAGHKLSNVDEHIKTALSLIDKIKTSDFRTLAYFYHYSLLCLKQSDLDQAHIEKCEQEILTSKNITEKAFFYSQSIKLYYHFNHFSAAISAGKKHAALEEYAIGMVSVLIGSFYYALAMSADALSMRELSRQHKKEFKKILRRIKRWNKWCPANFKHYLLLLSAEEARLKGKSMLASEMYQAAIEAADAKNSYDMIAVANERAGIFYLLDNVPDKAKLHMQIAYDAYKSWGALKKCELLKNQYPDWIEQSRVVIVPDEISVT